jgi:two-component system cell cycle response regulator CtrA
VRLLLVAKAGVLSAFRGWDDRCLVVHADTPEEALSILRHETVDAVVVDIKSFAEDGFAFIRRLRVARNDTPLVALTAHYPDDRVRALRLGADDAIALSIDVSELRARIAAVIRRHRGLSQSLVEVGALSLSLDSREVRFRNIPFRLTAKEYSMLELLVLRKGQIVTKDMFLSHLYGGADEPEMKIIDVFICKLRRRLNSVGAVDIIETVWGRGYTIRTGDEGRTVPLTMIATADRQQPAGRYQYSPITQSSRLPIVRATVLIAQDQQAVYRISNKPRWLRKVARWNA